MVTPATWVVGRRRSRGGAVVASPSFLFGVSILFSLASIGWFTVKFVWSLETTKYLSSPAIAISKDYSIDNLPAEILLKEESENDNQTPASLSFSDENRTYQIRSDNETKSLCQRTRTIGTKQQIHFRTYGNDKYAAAKERITKEACHTGWFNTVKALGPDNLSQNFKEKYRDVLAFERGGGYWIWKFDVIEQAMSEMQEGDFLVYLDSGSEVNIGGEKRFYEYIKMVNESKYDMLCLRLPFPEEQWTTERIFSSFNVTAEVRKHVATSGQYEANTMLLQKGPHYRKWMDLILSVLELDPMIITDKYNEEASRMNKKFQDNRHDQSIQSVSRKKLGCVVISGYESKFQRSDKPFHVTRNRVGNYTDLSSREEAWYPHEAWYLHQDQLASERLCKYGKDYPPDIQNVGNMKLLFPTKSECCDAFPDTDCSL